MHLVYVYLKAARCSSSDDSSAGLKSVPAEPEEDEDDLILGLQTPNPVNQMLLILPDVEMTPVDQTVIPENSRKKDKQKAHVTDDKQVKNQLTTANPGYEAVACQRHNSLRYPIYLGPAEDNSRVKTLGSTIKCSVKRQHKYQTLRVKIALSSFALSQFNKFWTTDLGGIPVR
ncbi:unnamed protein product [Rhizophagus irregularis]|nr:unnamed protein product [Rhizophagus irregularis]